MFFILFFYPAAEGDPAYPVINQNDKNNRMSRIAFGGRIKTDEISLPQPVISLAQW